MSEGTHGAAEGKMTLDQILDEVEGRAAAPVERQAASVAPAAISAPEGNPLAGLLNSPTAMQLVGVLPTLLALIKPGDAAKPSESRSEGARTTGDAQALLCALRPYLGARRRDLTDRLLRLWKLQAVLKTIKLE